MTAVLITLADAITAELNDATWDGLTFEAERNYADWDLELKDFDTLYVDVVPVDFGETELDGRNSVGYSPSVDIAIRKKFRQADLTDAGKIDLEEIDRLVLLVQEMHEFFIKPSDDTTIGRRLQTYTDASWRDTIIRSTYS